MVLSGTIFPKTCLSFSLIKKKIMLMVATKIQFWSNLHRAQKGLSSPVSLAFYHFYRVVLAQEKASDFC